MEHFSAEFWGGVGLVLGAIALIYAIKADGQLTELLKAVRRLERTPAA